MRNLLHGAVGLALLLATAAPAQADLHSFAASFSTLTWGSYSTGVGASGEVLLILPRTVGGNVIDVPLTFSVYGDGSEIDTASLAGLRLTTPPRHHVSMFVQARGGTLTWSGNKINRGFAVVPGVGLRYNVNDKMFVTGQVEFYYAHFPYGSEHPISASGGVGWNLAKQP